MERYPTKNYDDDDGADDNDNDNDKVGDDVF